MKSVAISKFLVSIVLASADEHPSVGTKELAHRSFAPVRHSRTSLISGSERDEGWGKPSRFLLYHANMRSNKILHHGAIADAALRQPPSLSHHHNPSRHPRSTQSIGPARINRNQQTIARPCTAIGQCTLLKLLTVCSRPDVSFSATHLFSLYPVQNDGGAGATKVLTISHLSNGAHRCTCCSRSLRHKHCNLERKEKNRAGHKDTPL